MRKKLRRMFEFFWPRDEAAYRHLAGLEREIVPIELWGRWVAWSDDGVKILGHGDTLAEARDSAENVSGLRFMKLPPLESMRATSERLSPMTEEAIEEINGLETPKEMRDGV